ncbi:MAG TPA: LysM peptidoglycan-binding domain-containing protein [Micromonosporaceae bacterium]
MTAAHARPAPPIRLTRRGRTVLLLLLCALAAVVLALGSPPSDAAGPAGPAPTAVVQPGDTLWSIAEQYVPDLDPITAIEEIRELNDMPSYTVYAGQRLRLPARR